MNNPCTPCRGFRITEASAAEIIRREFAVLHLEAAWLCGMAAASLQRFALVVTRQANNQSGQIGRIPDVSMLARRSRRLVTSGSDDFAQFRQSGLAFCFLIGLLWPAFHCDRLLDGRPRSIRSGPCLFNDGCLRSIDSDPRRPLEARRLAFIIETE